MFPASNKCNVLMFTGVGGGWRLVGTNDAATWWQMIRHVGHALFHSHYYSLSDIFQYKSC